MSSSVPPGWYPDTIAPTGNLRYWDGNTWTDYTQAPPVLAPRPNASRLSWAGLIVSSVGLASYFVVGVYPFIVGGYIAQEGYMAFVAVTGLIDTAVLAVGFVLAFLGFRKSRSKPPSPPLALLALVLCGLVLVPALLWAISVPIFYALG